MRQDADQIMEGSLSRLKENPREKLTRYDRLRYVAGLILMGFREGEIVRLSSEKYKVPPLYIMRDIKAVRKRWKAEGGPRMEKLRNDAMGRAIETVVIALGKVREDPQPKAIMAAVKAQEYLARLLGIDRGVPQINLTNNNIVQLTQNDVKPDGTPLDIEWASDEQKLPPGLNRLMSLDLGTDG